MAVGDGADRVNFQNRRAVNPNVSRLHGVVDGSGQVDVLAVAGSQAKFKQAFEFVCFAGVVQDLRDVIGGEVKVQLNGVAVGCSNHAVFNLVAAFFVSVRNGFEVPSSQPMVMASLVADGF